jgi:hypothetical protein
METYHKISTPYKRHFSGPNKGKLIYDEWAAPEFKYLAGNEWEFTEKVDGTNIRIGWSASVNFRPIRGRSDNASIPAPLHEYLQAKFTHDFMASVYPDTEDMILFGEGYGPKIQGGGKYRGDHSFVLFDVKIGNFWLDRANVDDVASKLGIESVPVIGIGTLWDAIEMVKGESQDVFINSQIKPVAIVHTGLQSRWGNFEAEGIVARPIVPMFNRKGERIVTKIKAVDFR